MKLKKLKSILFSTTGDIQFAVVYDYEEQIDLENGCSIEYAIANYGEQTVRRIQAYEGELVIEI